MNTRPKAYKIKNWMIHKHYFVNELYNKINDIGLIQLDRSINFEKQNGYMRTNGICLPDPNYNRSNEEEYALISGWGHINIHGDVPQSLKMGWIKILKPFYNQSDLHGRIYVYKRYPFPNGSIGCMVSPEL